MTNSTVSNLDYALRYAELGWHVFPLVPGDKNPLVDGGFHTATTDSAQIQQWWAENPTAGIGLNPHKSGLCVIDVDVKNGADGPTQLKTLEEIYGTLPDTLKQQSPSSDAGGIHLAFRCDKALSNTKLAADIDMRSANGYIVVEPTKLADGKGYGWLDWDVLNEELPNIASLPQWVIDVQAHNASKAAQGQNLELPKLDLSAQPDDGLIERLNRFLDKSAKARHRWDGGTDGLKDKTGSTRDHSMVALLKIAGFNYQETVTLLLPWPHGSAKKARKDDRYWQRCWNNTSNPKEAANDVQWREPADPFVRYPTPTFPLHCLPESLAKQAQSLSAGSGFDAGAYGFAFLIAASGLIDHRKRLTIGPMRVPPNLWGGLVAQSGGGKSPVLNAATAKIEAENTSMMRKSHIAHSNWKKKCDELKKSDVTEMPPPPPFRQLVLDDSTTEALRKIMPDNPEGLLLIAPEVSEWLGRMDAYSTGSKDRGVWIRAYDTGPVTINRAGQMTPTFIENCSVSLLSGIQPEILGMKFARFDSTGADGLYQRILCYQMREQKEVNYFAEFNDLGKANTDLIFSRMLEWREGDKYKHLVLATEALELAQTYHRDINLLSKRTPAKRLAEHLGKYPGLVGRLAFVLQMLFDAAEAKKSPSSEVTELVFRHALEIMKVLYWHADAVYQDIDAHSVGMTQDLVKSAAEAILAKSWLEFGAGDLTRYATGWRHANEKYKTAAIDLLIDLGWINDITPVEMGRRGRPAQGKYLVVPEKFISTPMTRSADRVWRLQLG